MIICIDEGVKILIRQERLEIVQTAGMNDRHLEAMLLINKLSVAIQNSDADAVKENFIELIEHTQEHCQYEEKMMVEKKFPPYQAHKDEHDLALDDMHKAATSFTKTEDFEVSKKYIESNLSPWFIRHTETMDTVTSMFLENSEAHLPIWNKMKK